jgi:hypothetical protein
MSPPAPEERIALPIQKMASLQEIYNEFEVATSPYRQGALCRPGCAFCCTHFGRLDITTLEGLVIQERIGRFGEADRVRIRRKVERNRRDKEHGRVSVCPFIDEESRCRIYEARPFSCRQLYSLAPCENRGPTVHRRVVELARESVSRLQCLDENGYSGHLTFILRLLETRSFLETYLAGGFEPGRIQDFGKTHGIVIHRRAVQNPHLGTGRVP